MNDTSQDTQAGIDWQTWLDRWDVQQAGYLPDREARFDAMFDVLDYLMPEQWTALDLASGPGCISQRLLARYPNARCIAIDYDPLLLAIGQGAMGDVGGRLRWFEADLAAVDLVDMLGEGKIDAVLSTTALHWLPGASLWRVFAQLGKVVRPGGVFLNGDNMDFANHLPTFQKMTKARYEEQQTESFKKNGIEDWEQWWKAVKQVPGLEALAAEREARFGHRKSEENRPNYDTHKTMLQNAGFREVDTIWQHRDNRILLGVR